MAARLDLKADRAARRLIVSAAHLEPGASRDKTAPALVSELREMALWLGLERIGIEPRGDLASALQTCLSETA
jgi:uncharacterized protein YcaQ